MATDAVDNFNDENGDKISALIAHLQLIPHPEGGHYREIFRAPAADGGRSAVTSIYYLLGAGERSVWHRIDATEIWHYHDGAPLNLWLGQGGEATCHLLGPDIAAGQQSQIVVPPGMWQAAESTGDYTLVGCTVAPGFEFDGFELAPDDVLPA